jgi:hypothetical protein
VRRVLEGAVLAKVDLSTDADRAEGGALEVLGRSFTLRGLPRIVLFDREGRLVVDWNGPPPEGAAPPHDPEAFLEAWGRLGAPRPAAP